MPNSQATYQKVLLSTYLEKKKDGNLSRNLCEPTRGRLREECFNLYNKKSISSTDKGILLEFLDSNDRNENLGEKILDDDGKFRPLDNLLKGEVESSHERNLDLLAWLIDFPNRPYSFWTTTINPVDNLPPAHKKDGWIISKNKIWVSSFSVITISIFIFIFSFPKQCMYWTGEQYLPINCNETVNAAVIPLNKRKVEKLKRITRLDTITRNSIGNVWYAKVKVDSVEFYTDSGEYPLDIRKRLLPVTDYILEKYLFSKRIKE